MWYGIRVNQGLDSSLMLRLSTYYGVNIYENKTGMYTIYMYMSCIVYIYLNTIHLHFPFFSYNNKHGEMGHDPLLYLVIVVISNIYTIFVYILLS
ncbi:hypothetical protein Hanom_Chr03g00271881 [Helianthus anomalus]